MARIRSATEQLEEQPYLGRVSEMPRVRVRSIVNFPHLVFYAVGENEVVILHVRHTARRRPEPGEVI
ncbi:MAG: type II toxin-antitoxin system RelE/ParE family toxin [Hyphomicrobium sp.]|nr:type II toxin-antitoxin system RelE/ParE family toxin [Hyphomicrobium sp.]